MVLEKYLSDMWVILQVIVKMKVTYVVIIALVITCVCPCLSNESGKNGKIKVKKNKKLRR